MTRPDLSSPRAKIQWADSQITILDAQIKLFLEKKPYGLRVKPKPNFIREPNEAEKQLFAVGRFYELFAAERIPHHIVTSSGMIIQAVRDSLDHLVHALALKNGAIDATDAYFVITKDEEGFSDKRARKKLRRLSPEDRAVIEALKPYKGGNDLLYSLHWLSNKSKHRQMIAHVAGAESLNLVGHGWLSKLLVLPIGNSLCPDENIICLEATEDLHLDITATISFREVCHSKSQPVIETLREFSSLANSIVDLFDYR